MMTVEELRALVHRQAGEIEFRLRHFVQLLKNDAEEVPKCTCCWPATTTVPPDLTRRFEIASSILDAARKLAVTCDAIRGLEEAEEDRRREASRTTTADV